MLLGNPSGGIAPDLYGIVLVDTDGDDLIERVEIIGNVVTKACLSGNPVAGGVIGIGDAKLALYLFAQAAFGIEPALDLNVRILGFGQVAVGVVGKLLDETVGQDFLEDTSQRISGVVDGAPKRVGGSGKVATGIVSIPPRLPPIVHLFDDTPQGIALKLIGFPALVGNNR